ncbi:membrane protein insertase YidC, partial [Paraburkholderia sp. Se-20369]|nr:membrane protein insertase YidC [Paraburkholderia sp. Se-20369]
MDIKRTVLWVIFFMSAVMLYDNWQRSHGRPSMFFPNTTQSTPAAAGGASGTGATGNAATTAGVVHA